MSFHFASDSLPERRQEIIDLVRGKLIVSSQAADGHAMRNTTALTCAAKACVDTGTPAIRCGGYGGVTDIAAIAKAVDVPVFGLTKEGSEGVYITPTRASIRAVAEAGAAVVCADATDRPRPDGSTFADLVEEAHQAGILIMADCGTPEDAQRAHEAGADILSTTLAGYTPDRPKTEGPDLDCIRDARALVGPDAFLIGEGRFHEPAQLPLGLQAGADAIIVGTAITDPGWVAQHFAAALK